VASRPLVVRIVGDADFKDASKKVGAFGKSIGGLFAGLGAGAGLALANGLGDAFGAALDIGAAQDKLSAQLGVTGAEAEELGRIAGSLYANAYGESFDDVADVVADAIALDISTDDLEAISGQAFSMGVAFEGAAGEYLQLAKQFQTEGFTGSVEESLDLLTTSFQQLPSNMRDPMAEAVTEYGVFLDSLGFTTEEIFGGLTEAASKGEFSLDNFGNAIKEFGIRATDGSKATTTAFDAIGYGGEENLKNLTNALLEGGAQAQDATQVIVEGLLSIEDPGEQAANAIALFGTPLEDLGVTKIPDFLQSLQDMGAGFDDVEGAAAQLDTELNDNLRTKLEAFRRQGLQKLADFMSNIVIPVIERVADVVGRTLGPAFDAIGDVVSKAVDAFRVALAFLQGDTEQMNAYFANLGEGGVGRFFSRVARVAFEAGETFSAVAGKVRELFGGAGGGGAFGGVSQTLNDVLGAIEPVVVAVGDFFNVLRTGSAEEDFSPAAVRMANAVRELGRILINDVIPAAQEFAAKVGAVFQELGPKVLPVLEQIGATMISVIELAAAVWERVLQAIVFIWERWGDEILNVVTVIFEAVIGVLGGALDIIQGLIRTVTALMQGDWSEAWSGIVQILEGAWTIIKSVIRLGWEAIKLLFRAAIGILKVAFLAFWSAIKAVASDNFAAIQALIRLGWTAIQGLFSTYIAALKAVWGGLWTALRTFASRGLDAIKSAVTRGLGAMVSAFRRLPGQIASAVRGLFNPIYNQFKSVIDRVRNLWSKLDFKIPEISVPGLGSVGGGTISGLVNNLPFFADGNVARTPTVGVFGEYPGARSNPEITTPESTMAEVFRNVLREQRGGGQPTVRQIAENMTVVTQPGRDLAAEFDLLVRMELGA